MDDRDYFSSYNDNDWLIRTLTGWLEVRKQEQLELQKRVFELEAQLANLRMKQ